MPYLDVRADAGGGATVVDPPRPAAPAPASTIDIFPDQHRKPVTDHHDFENLMPQPVMTHLTTCLNTGNTC
jgi:hypothetical protein